MEYVVILRDTLNTSVGGGRVAREDCVRISYSSSRLLATCRCSRCFNIHPGYCYMATQTLANRERSDFVSLLRGALVIRQLP
jgi:hypothetical protein